MNLPILYEIEAGVASVTQEDLDRAGRQLDAFTEGEAVLGVISDSNIQRLWSLAFKWKGEAQRLAGLAEYQAVSDTESQELLTEAARYDNLASLAREIFWVEARFNIGGDSWLKESIGIRRDYTLVAQTKKSTPSGIARILGISPE